MRPIQPATLLLFADILQFAYGVDSKVDLPYASYQGSPLSSGITQWLGIRYAAPPLGNLRFQAPQDPPSDTKSTQPANAHGPYCLGVGSGPPSDASSEDCLFLDVYAPSDATSTSKLPVYFFIQGGGFSVNSNPNLNGTGLVLAGQKDLVIVTINYRVGPYGFLAAQEILDGGSVNNGLKDQRKAMQWVQQYISNFGGDPGHVTIGGDSAGAESVDLHVTAYGGRNDNLFHATTAESQAFPQLSTVNESQFMYDNLVNRAKCGSSKDTLACLRGLSATELQAININTPFPGAKSAPIYMYGPTLDDDFVTDYTSRAYAQGKFLQLPAISGDVTNEGTVFTPKSTSSLNDSNTFIQNQFPAMGPVLTGAMNAMYPVDGTPSFADSGRYWRQVSNAYGEMRFNCPSAAVCDAYSAHGVASNWNYRWNVVDPSANTSGTGVTHTVELNAIWGPNNTNGAAPVSYKAGGANAAIVPVIQAYWTSFIRSYDPNTYRLSGSPQWDAWRAPNSSQSRRAASSSSSSSSGGGDSGNDLELPAPGMRLLFQTNDTAMEAMPLDQQRRCNFWNMVAMDLKQ